jgi:hypothetical protein
MDFSGEGSHGVVGGAAFDFGEGGHREAIDHAVDGEHDERRWGGANGQQRSGRAARWGGTLREGGCGSSECVLLIKEEEKM